MKNLLSLLTLLFFIGVNAQKTPHAVQVTYIKSSNGTILENQDPIVLFADKKQTIITSEKIIEKKADFPYEFFYLTRDNNRWYQTAQLSTSKTISTVDTVSIANQKLTLTKDTKKILGYLCKKATTSINSNSIDIWYTEALDHKGAPSALGQNLGLVLEVTRNGNYSITASKLTKLKSIPTGVAQIPSLKSTIDL